MEVREGFPEEAGLTMQIEWNRGWGGLKSSVGLRKGLLCGSDGKESACNVGDPSLPWIEKTPWSRKWQLAPVFLPGQSMDRGTWWATVHGVANSQT